MTACSTQLEQIFQNPLSGNTSFIDSLSSWNQINTIKPLEVSSYTEIFGELHFKDNSLDNVKEDVEKFKNNGMKKSHSLDFLFGNQKTQYVSTLRKSESFLNLESLHLCTEGLGFESSADVDIAEELESEDQKEWTGQEKEKDVSISIKNSSFDNMNEFKRPKTIYKGIPPPISCMGRSGQPRVGFQAYRKEGRFILQEVSIPSREFLHASRAGGHLKLYLVQPEYDINEEEENKEDEEEDNFQFDEDDNNE